ncbi:NHLP leader peptide family RiPP precursor [Pelotomaculum propionicicum]|uniref:Nitrile hydratase alpha/Thiocyanate hydrolase gamma domain-containing protein n=1 Tax=Pelotomaculum propionicicum TaxID=258475 RepID=A0A4Y7RM26_9FIRM|nr:NHLP leader peptide family RiPP precursor [Pelotomaculum propionicicum]TEB09923.1 hypothetical protein Pmgp_02726 [Pelotomaculum propionicicum]
MGREAMSKKLGQIIARAWSDADFKARLLANPAETLQAAGVEVPAGVKVKAVENTNEQFYLVIPQKPDDLSEEQLSNVAGGYNPGDLCDPCQFGSHGPQGGGYPPARP